MTAILRFLLCFSFMPVGSSDIMVSVDVSDSMIECNFPSGKDMSKLSRREVADQYPPSDPEGFRWDAIQFLIDIASPDDRFALVLFKADAVIATGFLQGNSNGFVSIGTHRGKLKQMVASFRKGERDRAMLVRQKTSEKPNNYFSFLEGDSTYLIPGEQPITIPHLRNGTSSLNSIRLVAGKLLSQGAKSQARLYLFTDGVETGIATNDTKFDTDNWEDEGPVLKPGTDFLSALSQRKPGTPASGFLKGIIGNELAKFSNTDRPCPIFGFTLGPYCDTELINELARVSGNKGFQSSGVHYHAETNLELLERLQKVGWETRDMWQIRQSSRPGATNLFKLSGSNQWAEVGALVHAVRAGVALAPGGSKVNPEGMMEQLDCDSHHFIRFSDAGSRPDTHIDAPVRSQDDQMVCVWGVKTAKPLFEFMAPAETEPLTPLDAIPFRVRFQSSAGNIKPEDFAVKARLARLVGGNEKAGQVIEFPLLLKRGSDSSAEFFAEHVLDGSRKPTDGINPELMGTWAVDMTIDAVAGPLAGASRNMLRREISINTYPHLAMGVNQESALTNNESSEMDLGCRLDLKYPPADLSRLVTLNTSVVVPDGWPKGLASPEATRQTWVSGNGTVTVGLSGTAWSALPVDKSVTGLVLKATTPWAESGDGISIPFSVRKSRFRLRCVEEREGLRVDASGNGAVGLSGELRVWLDSGLGVEEKLAIAGANSQGTVSIDLKSSEQGSPNLVLKVHSKGGLVARGRGGRETPVESPVPLELEISGPMAPGRFHGILKLGGPGVTEINVPILVDRDQPVLQFIDSKGQWTEKPSIDFGVQHGTDVACPVRLISFNTKKPIESVVESLADPVLSDKAEKRTLPVRFDRNTAAKERHDLSFLVDSSVFPGRYESSLRLRFKAAGKEDSLRIPVYFQVARHAIEAVPLPPAEGGPRPVGNHFRLEPSTDGKPLAQAKFRLDRQLIAGNGEVRWYVTPKPVSEGFGAFADPAKAALRFRMYEQKGQDIGKQSVLSPSESPADAQGTTAIGQKGLPIIVEADTAGLEPGLYRCDMRFFAKTDGAEKYGNPYDLKLEFLVTGRKVAARWAEGKPIGRVREPANAIITVESFGMDGAGSGLLESVGPEGFTGEKIPVNPAGNGLPDPAYPLRTDKVVHETRARAMPSLIGSNNYVLTWDGKKTALQLPPWKATGRPTISPVVGEPDQEIRVKVSLSPGLAKDKRISMVAISQSDTSKSFKFDLADDGQDGGDERAGDGDFSGKLKLPDFDRYLIRAENREPPELEPAEVVVGFISKRYPGQGDFDQDPGWFGKPVWKDHELLEITNKRNQKCRYVVRYRYFADRDKGLEAHKRVHDQNQKDNSEFLDQLPEDAFRDFDVKRDFMVIPVANGMKPDEGNTIAGEIDVDTSLNAGLEVTLSEEAKEGDRSHPCFGALSTQFLVLEVALEWDDGFRVVRRSMATVNSRPFIIVWGPIMGVGLVILAVAGYFVNTNWKKISKWLGSFSKREKPTGPGSGSNVKNQPPRKRPNPFG